MIHKMYGPGPGEPDPQHGHEPDDRDEQSLRRLLHGAVDDLEPSPGSLEHLRHAVPARRTRRRQILVGVAAAVVLGGAALPALVHVATTGGAANDRPANAASSERAPGVHGGQDGDSGDQSGQPAGSGGSRGDQGDDKKKDHSSQSPDSGAGGVGPDPSDTFNAASAACTRDQLGAGTGSADPADAEGRVYGSFRVPNVSDRPCAVDGAGVVVASRQGGGDTSQIQVLVHTAGDPATGLPESVGPEHIILEPGQSYLIRFAWIPAAGGSTSCSNTGTPPTSEPTTGDGTVAQDGSDSPDTGDQQPEATVLVSHTPETGDPVAASAKLTRACAGTVYRTGILGAS